MQYDVKHLLEPTERAAKGDESSITFQLWNGRSIRFVAVVTTLKGFKVWTQHRSKGKPLKESNGQFDVDLTCQSLSIGTSHGNVKLHLARSPAQSLT